jgi:hypothetical protein
MNRLDHKVFVTTLTDREEEALIQDPIKFFVRLQNKYVFKNPGLSMQFKEIADEHRRIAREDSSVQQLIVFMAKKARRSFEADGETRVSLWH